MAGNGRPKNVKQRQICDRIHLLMQKIAKRMEHEGKPLVVELGRDEHSVIVRPTMFNPLSGTELKALIGEFDYVCYSDVGLIIRDQP